MVGNPRRLLLIDSLGALITFLVTAFLLVPERIPTGLPVTILYAMAFVAGVFCLIGLIALAIASAPRIHLRSMAVLNAAYCLITAAVCVSHSSTLTIWGFIYFSLECIVVSWLVLKEWRASKMQTIPKV